MAAASEPASNAATFTVVLQVNSGHSFGNQHHRYRNRDCHKHRPGPYVEYRQRDGAGRKREQCGHVDHEDHSESDGDAANYAHLHANSEEQRSGDRHERYRSGLLAEHSIQRVEPRRIVFRSRRNRRSCLLGTMTNGAITTITIFTSPQQAGSITNNAMVTADQGDPNLANNTASQTELVVAATKVTLRSFSAHFGTDKNGAKRAVLVWKTSGEARNLGFNVYREQNGNRVRMNSAPIAGSALMMSGFLPEACGADLLVDRSFRRRSRSFVLARGYRCKRCAHHARPSFCDGYAARE